MTKRNMTAKITNANTTMINIFSMLSFRLVDECFSRLDLRASCFFSSISLNLLTSFKAKGTLYCIVKMCKFEQIIQIYLNRIKSFAVVMTKFVREQTPCPCGRQGAITKILIEHLLINDFSNCFDHIYIYKKITNKIKQTIGTSPGFQLGK